MINFKLGEEEVVIHHVNGRTVFIESKGFSIEGEVSSREYSIMGDKLVN